MPFEIPPWSNPDGWLYGDAQAVQDWIGILNLRILSNQGGEAGESASNERITMAGRASDAYFNVMLRGGPYKVPLVVGGVPLKDLDSTHETRLFMRELSARDVICRLNDYRKVTASNGTNLDETLAVVRADVQATLAAIKNGDITLLADLAPTSEVDNPPGVFISGIPIYRNGCRPPGDEYSRGCL
jgi:hypothetical protein